MSDLNKNTLLSLDYSEATSIGDWAASSGGVLGLEGGSLRVRLAGVTDSIGHALLPPDPSNDRLRIRIDFEVGRIERTGGGTTSPSMEVRFCILTSEGWALTENCVPFSGLEEGEKVSYFLVRTYPITLPAEELHLFIDTTDGWENTIYIKDVLVEGFTFHEKSVRTFFVLDEVLQEARTASDGVLELKEWKVNGMETLTTAFYSDTPPSSIASPLSTWSFAKADIDGANRTPDTSNPNTFNPFAHEWGLLFATEGEYYGWKPTGTANDNNYGNGPLQIGVSKPEILNGNLESKKGVFFIDIDYRRHLRVAFELLLSNPSGTTLNRSYFIEWDPSDCRKEFYYFDDLNGGFVIDQQVNGFLSGITGPKEEDVLVEIGIGGCNDKIDSWERVYLDTNDPFDFVPTPLTDRIFTDADRTIPYNNQTNQTYRLRVSTEDITKILGYSFTFNYQHYIDTVDPCYKDPPNDAVIIEWQSSNPCYSCMTFTIYVPQGQIRKVVVTSSFVNSGTYIGRFCSGGVEITSDLEEFITQTKTYSLGINGGEGQNQQVSNILIEAYDLLDSLVGRGNLDRMHADIKC